MSSTDTNQASGDEQTKAIYEAMQIPYLSERHDAIKDLVRTEKLKLLAEVRERVVGEDIELPEILYAHTTDGGIINNNEVQDRVAISNAIRAEQRESLTKLEADL